MAVELWDNEYGNIVDDFDTEEKALSFVRDTIAAVGPKAVESWYLDSTPAVPPVRGAALIERAMHVPA